MVAGLIAELADVDLESFDFIPRENFTPVILQRLLEIGRTDPVGVENREHCVLESHQQQLPLPLPGKQADVRASVVTQ